MVPESKRCSVCGVEKPLEAFSRQKLGKHGRRANCKECAAAYNDRWRSDNAERIRQRDLSYRRQHRDRHNAYNRAWNAANPARIWAAQQRYSYGVTAPGADYATLERVLARIAFYGGKCAYCGGEADSVDHRIPLSRGGAHWPSNIVPCCRRCNSAKGKKKPSEWERGDAKPCLTSCA